VKAHMDISTELWRRLQNRRWQSDQCSLASVTARPVMEVMGRVCWTQKQFSALRIKSAHRPDIQPIRQ